jgi:hypothetical protein
VTCVRCGHDIRPGQAYVRLKREVLDGVDLPHELVIPEHVSCPTERQVMIAQRWGRWA